MDLQVENLRLRMENFRLVMKVSNSEREIREQETKFSEELSMLRIKNMKLEAEAERREFQHQEEIRRLKESRSREVMVQQKRNEYMQLLSDLNKDDITRLELKVRYAEEQNLLLKEEITSTTDKMNQLSSDYNKLKEEYEAVCSAKDSFEKGRRTLGWQVQPQEETVSHSETKLVETADWEARYGLDVNINVPGKQVKPPETDILNLEASPRPRQKEKGAAATRVRWTRDGLVVGIFHQYDCNEISGNREEETLQAPKAPQKPHKRNKTWI